MHLSVLSSEIKRARRAVVDGGGGDIRKVEISLMSVCMQGVLSMHGRCLHCDAGDKSKFIQ